MKTKLVTACAVAAALMVPVAAYSQYDTGTTSRDRDTAPAAKKESSGPVDDAVISTKIKSEYAKDKDVSALRINVDTDKGVVTLRGTAKSKAEADKAVSIAKNVSGVSSVKSEIKVEPAK
jgi:hyperosmotically inducible periplasmic protein